MVFLPPPSLFRAFYNALPSDAALSAETLLKSGVRIFELQILAAAWPKRVRGPKGAAVVKIVGKGRRERNVYIPAALADKLDTHLGRDGLFLREDGKPWTVRTLSEVIMKAARAVGATDENSSRITAHILRHAYASWAYHRMKKLFLENKLQVEPLLVLQELLGHASYETTWNTYVHLFRFDGEDNPEEFGIGPIEVLLEVMEHASFSNALRTPDE